MIKIVKKKKIECGQYVLDVDAKVPDDFFKKIRSLDILVINYPDISHLVRIVKPKTSVTVLNEVPEIDGNKVSKVISLYVNGSVVVKNMPKLYNLRITGYSKNIVIEDCPQLSSVDLETAEKVRITGKKKIRIYYNNVEEFDIPKSAYLMVRDYNTLTKLYDTVYNMNVRVSSQEDLERHHPESLNVNVLIISGATENLDFTKFNLNEVTTIKCKGFEAVFADNCLKRVISWTSYPWIGHSIPCMPHLKFLFITYNNKLCKKGVNRENNEIEVQNVVYDNSHIYENVLTNKNSFRFELRDSSITIHEFDKQRILDYAIEYRDMINTKHGIELKNPHKT